jgi:hypothetical protein
MMSLILFALATPILGQHHPDLPPPSQKIFKDDLPFIYCQTCEHAAQALFDQAKEKRVGLPKKSTGMGRDWKGG